MLFAHTQAGDLTPHLSEYFDTTIGLQDRARELPADRRAPRAGSRPEILFVSDVMAELDAARAAGVQTALAARSDTMPMGATHRLVRTFDRLG